METIESILTDAAELLRRYAKTVGDENDIPHIELRATQLEDIRDEVGGKP